MNRKIDGTRWLSLAAALCLLLCLWQGPAAGAEGFQPCHKVQLTKQDTTQKNGSVIRLWKAETALSSVDQALAEITADMVDRLAPTLAKAGNKTNKNSRLEVGIRYSRTGLRWMSFAVQARTIYHRGLIGQELVTRTYDMVSGERILLTDLFETDSEGWQLLADAVETQCQAYFPDETADPDELSRLCSQEGLEQLDFTLHGMRLVLHIPAAQLYAAHAQKNCTLLEVTLMYPDIRPYMTETAREETDNARYYKMVALTFDDGPARTNTTLVLNSLMEQGCTATFFVIGNRIKDYRDLVQREHDEGHSIGYHNWSHANVSKVSASTLRANIKKCDNAMLDAIGLTARYDRVPYGLYNNMIRAKLGWSYIQWSVDTYDWRDRTTATIMKNITKQIEDGDIILCHDIKDKTPATATAICQWCMEQGYMLVTVDELFARDGVTLEPDTCYWHCADGETGLKQ